MIQTLRNRLLLTLSERINILGIIVALILLLVNLLWPNVLPPALGLALLACFHAAALLLHQPAETPTAAPLMEAPAFAPNVVVPVADRLSRAVTVFRDMSGQQTVGATEQSEVVGQTHAQLDNLLDLSQRAQEQARTLTLMVREATETSGSGQVTIQLAIQGMNQIRTQVSAIAGTILALAQFTQRIDDIITSVSEIAIQSNLLALNASIEAARAGTHGRGFAVVADEVRSLSQQSTQAAKQVRAILGEIQAAMKDTVRATEEGLKGVDAGVIVTQDAEVLIRELAQVVGNSQEAINEVYNITRQQVNTLEEIAISVERVERIAQRQLSSAHTIEMTALDVSQLATDLRQNLTSVQQNADDYRKQNPRNANDNAQENGAA